VAAPPRTLVVALAPALALALALSAAPGAAAAVPRTTLPAVEGQVMCVTCKISLTVAQSPQADRERDFIQRLIDRGRDEAQIKRALVYQYGPAVLALPSDHGFDLAAYIVPAAVVLGLLAMAAVLLPRWRRHARSATVLDAAEAPAAGLSPADAARLEADMARFD
jgi:cytochrome c-type biogenesis protein CcmH/NrfF